MAALGLCLGAERIPNLNELRLDHCDLGPYECDHLVRGLRRCAVLVVLSIQDNHIGSQGLESLAAWLPPSCRILKELFLGNNGITDQGLCALAKALPLMENLEYLIMRRNAFTKAGLAALAMAVPQTQKLKTVEYGQREACPEIVRNLARAPQLRAYFAFFLAQRGWAPQLGMPKSAAVGFCEKDGDGAIRARVLKFLG